MHRKTSIRSRKKTSLRFKFTHVYIHAVINSDFITESLT